MLKLRNKVHTFYSSLAQQASQDFSCPLLVTILIEVWSYLHSLSLLFISAFSSSSLQHYSVLPVLRDITCLTAIFPYSDNTSVVNMAELIYAILAIYFIAWICLFGYIMASIVKNQALSERFSRIFTIGTLFHSKILFFPIHYFVLIIIVETGRCLSDTENSCESGYIPAAIIFCILNMLLAFCKELSFYQIVKRKSSFSSKNNIVPLILLIQKTAITFLFAFFPDSMPVSRLSAFINFLIFAALIAVLYLKLPFYEMRINQVSMTSLGILVVFSLIFILKSFGTLKDKSIVELVLYLTSALLVRILSKILQNLTFKILQFEYLTPEQAVQLPVLLNSGLVSSSPFPNLQMNFSPDIISYFGLLKFQGIDPQNKSLDHEYEIYTVIINKFNLLLKKNPHSEVLKLSMAYIYLKKLKMRTKAVSLLSQRKLDAHSVPVKNSYDSIMKSIEDSFIDQTEDSNQLNYFNFFKYRELANLFKQDIQAEIANHTTFWKELTYEKVEIFKMINIAQGVNSKFLDIKKLWDKSLKTFETQFGALSLLYGVYLQTVRDLPHDGLPIISNYFQNRRNRDLTKANRISKILAENSAVITGSIETERLGKVIDASVSVKNLFNITKEKLIGQKVDMLMPNLVARRHDGFINAYNKSPRLNTNTNMTTLGRTVDGHFFSVEVTLKAFPFLYNGVCVIAYVEKIANKEPTFIVGDKGVILDYSKEIEEYFKIDKLHLNKARIQQFSSEFENILNAFNVSYNHSERDGEPLSPSNATIFRDMNEDKNFTGTVTQEPVLLSRNFPEIETYDDQPLLESITGMLSPTRSRRGDGKFFDLQPQSFRTHVSLLRSPADMPRNMPLSPKNTETVATICDRYKEGSKMTLLSVGADDSPVNRGKQFFVKVEPMFVAGSFYKLVKVKEVSKNSASNNTMADIFVGSLKKPSLGEDLKRYAKGITGNEDDNSFADNFPLETEKVAITQVKKDEPSINPKSSESKEVNSLQMRHSKGGMDSPNDNFDIEVKHNNHVLKTREGSSMKGSSKSEQRLAKTLNEVFSNEKVRRTTKVTIFVVYIAMLAVIVMATVDFIFARRSIEEVKSGIIIKSVVNKRLFYSTLAWQYMLAIYTQFGPYALPTLQPLISEQTLLMLDENDILKTNIQSVTDQRMVDVFFKKRVTMYDPTTREIFNSEPLDALTSTSILGVKNLFVASFQSTSPAQAATKLQAGPVLMFTMNNTANDYFLANEQELDDIEQTVNLIIDENIQRLELILGFENVALFLLACLLILLVKVVITSHSLAFKSIVSINQRSVHKRLTTLATFSDHLEENIESKKFGHGLSSFIENQDKVAKKSQAKHSHVRYSEDRLVHNGLIFHMIKYLTLAVFFILSISGVFIYSTMASQQSFNTLDDLNDKLSTTYEISYKINSLLSNICHLTLFFNRTDLPLRNEVPNDIISKDLDMLSTANSVLLDNLLNSKTGTTDAVIEKFLKNDICSFLTSQTDRYICQASSKDSPGLLNLNAQYVQQANNLVEAFRANPTLLNGQKLFTDFSNTSSTDLLTIQTAYGFLTTRLINQFQDEAESQKTTRLIIFIGILLSIFAVTIIIQLIPIRKFENIDILLRRVLKIIPYEVIRENKMFGSFLANEFGKDVDVIKRYL